MQLYAGSSKQFVEDTVQSAIGEKLKLAFFNYYRYNPPISEVKSWQNSLSRFCMIIQHAALMDQGILLEYQLPLCSKRIDCMVTGVNKDARANAVIIELKQWDSVSPSNVDDCVVTYVGGGLRDKLHPSKQAGAYQEYLEGCHTVFNTKAVELSSCSYLHNLQFDPKNELFHSRHQHILDKSPLFAGDQGSELEEFLSARVGKGEGLEVLAAVQESKYRVGKKLLDHVRSVIKGEKIYTLLDEQQVVFNSVLAAAQKGFHKKDKVVVLVKGGPGTGKSVIALNLVAELSGRGYNTQHATGSKAFTENIRKTIGSKAGAQFKFFNNYSNAARDVVDILVMDESHRIWASGNTRFTPAAKRSNRALIEELVDAAKVSVFFIDDLQVVRPGEVGSSSLIRETAEKLKATLCEFELEAQFRCNGSDGFVNWIDNTLGIRKTANVLWDSKDSFDFRIIDDVHELEAAIRLKQAEGMSARLTAGFCWPWSDPNTDGTLVDDVAVEDWTMPWNAKSESTRLGVGIPKSHYWASDANGINQVGCIYTAQGFEFDYVGVIFGKDLRYDPKTSSWVGDKGHSFDSVVKRSGDKFLELIKNTYRVLLSRGLKGCFVHFIDEDTRNFFRSRTD